MVVPEAVKDVGLKPVFVDIDKNLTIDPDSLSEKIIGVDFGADVLVKGDELDVGSISNDSLGLAVLVEP